MHRGRWASTSHVNSITKAVASTVEGKSVFNRLATAAGRPAPASSPLKARKRRQSPRTSVEALEGRTLLSATTGPTIVTPYQHDAEADEVAVVADFTADARPVDAYIGWGDGTIEDLTMDYTAAENAGR